MPTQRDVVKIASALPGAIKDPDYFAFSVAQCRGKPKGFAWVWLERIDPKKARVPQPKVLAVRVANELEKAALLDADPDVFFTEPHYNGYPAVLVRLAAITMPALRQVLTQAWRCVLPASTTPRAAAKPPARTPAARRAKPPARTSAAKRTAARPPAARRAKPPAARRARTRTRAAR